MTAIAGAQSSVVRKKPTMPGLGWWKSLLLTLPMTLLSAMLLLGSPQSASEADPLLLGSSLLVWVVINIFFYRMLYTGKTHRYRSILFIVIAFAFIITFMTTIIEERGSLALTESNLLGGETPFCHIVIPMTVIPALLTRTIIFPGSMLVGFASIATMFVLWIGASLSLGKGWCSWVCFYGGLDEGFSRLLKKPKITNINPKWTYLPYAVLIGIVLISAITLSPTYCTWLCPYKAVTEAPAITNITVLLQTIVFVVLFAGLVIILPLLTKRRIQCGLFCPFGAMQSFTNKLNVSEIRIDTEKCSECEHCINNCPTFSLDASSMKSGRPLISCTKCGQCVDICPKKAISYHIKGTPQNATPNLARVLFMYPAFLFMTAIGAGSVAVAIYRIVRLITTGSML
jgi:ferredoxin-type protein NapH